MTAIDNAVPFAVAIRLEIQQAVAAHSNLDYKAILARIEQDGKVSENELAAVRQALTAEVAAGSIDDARAKAIMSHIAASLVLSGSVEDRKVIRDSLDTMSMTSEQLSRAIEAARNQVDRGLLAKDVRAATADGEITSDELDGLWKKAVGRDGIVSAADVRTMYAALDSMLRAKKIDQKQFDALRSSLDASLLARGRRDEVDAGATDYIAAATTSHALSGDPATVATWVSALDMLEFATADVGPNRKMSGGTVAAFADMVNHAAQPVTDSVARAVAGALDAAVAAGTITKSDAKAIAATLDRRIAHERYGVGAKADFSLVQSFST